METKPTNVIQYAVDYEAIDPVKKMFQGFGRETAVSAKSRRTELEGCRGESVHIVVIDDMIIGSLIEGLGTRALIADEIYRNTSISHYHAIGWSAAQTIFNDMATSGIPPSVMHMYLSAGSNDVFADTIKMQDLGSGWKDACLREGCIWGGGETPMLRDLVAPGAFEIAGSTWGITKLPAAPIDSRNIKVGDCIIFIESSGIHDNGLTLTRDIRCQRLLNHGYGTFISDEITFGGALMKPTISYGPLVRMIIAAGVDIHSAINVTGHGLAKLARATAPFEYVVERLPEPQPVFSFIQKHSGLSDAEMYYKFNMGVGFALIVAEKDSDLTVGRAKMWGYKAWKAGPVQESSDGKKRVILPNGVVFTEKDVAIR